MLRKNVKIAALVAGLAVAGLPAAAQADPLEGQQCNPAFNGMWVTNSGGGGLYQLNTWNWFRIERLGGPINGVNTYYGHGAGAGSGWVPRNHLAWSTCIW